MVLGAFGLVVIIIVGLVLLSHRHPAATHSGPATNATHQSAAALSALPDDELAEIIGDDDNPDITYKIVSKETPLPGWLILKVIAHNEYGNFNQVVLLRQVANEKPDVVAGPGDSFPKSFLTYAGVPASIQAKLPVYNND